MGMRKRSLIKTGVASAVIAFIGMTSHVQAEALTKEEKTQGWVSLFDGKTFKGWRNYKGEGVKDGWKVVDGTMQHTVNGGDLITESQYGDYELKLDWKISEKGNSGIFFGVQESQPKIYFTGIEMQILDDQKHPDGKFEKHVSGACYGLYKPPAGAVGPVGSWNKVRVLKEGDHYQFFLNGVKTADFKTESEAFKTLVANSKFKKWPAFATHLKGHIGLQDHGDVVNFRNLKIREIKK